ncbi:zinc finger protein 778-like [Maniola hyperantus]|uniref:zinc finger protein 778-like n=1 Tax=Aphantopus hyperantus TaxID=2795564 RepID=UPI0037483634
MRCCVPFCRNTSDNVSEGTGKEISFHGFPSEAHLRAAWLRALGKQDNLPGSAVVCSQHFLHDDIYETESGLRQLCTGAVPSTVQVCMICLDTDAKLFLMNKHKLDEAYEKLTGHPLCDLGNLKQTLCVQCAQILINFSRFRDKSLRARALMMDLVGKHELISKRHIQMINGTKHQLKSNMVLTKLGPDNCDLHVLEHPAEDKQTELEETGHQVVVKTEGRDDSMSVDEDIDMVNEDDNNADNIKDELVTCNDEDISHYSIMVEARAIDEALYKALKMKHMSTNGENGDSDAECDTSQVCKPHTAVSSSSAHSSLITGNKQAGPSPSAYSAQTLVVPLPASLATSNEIKVPSTEEADTTVSCRYNKLTDCFVKLYDVFSKKVVPIRDGTAVRSCLNQNIASEDIRYQAKSHDDVSTREYVQPGPNTVQVIVSKTVQSKTQCSLRNSSHTEERGLICDYCQKIFTRKSILVKHIKTHAEIRWFTCKICQYKCKYPSDLKTHMQIHTGDKPFACKVCDYRCTTNCNLVTHMRTHTGIKPFACKLCDYKFTQNGHLVRHMRTHTGIKPFACKLCDYKFTQNGDLVRHMRTHTGIKPFACKLCDYKFTQNGHLVMHMRTHTGIKPFACKLCDYKFTHNGNLVRHMRTHTGIKPFLCKLCNYKCTTNSNLVSHMRTHTGDKPYSCKECEYKCAYKSSLRKHNMRVHTITGE